MERRTLEIPPGHHGEAVALILHDGLGVPHSHAKGLIDAGCVTLNGRAVSRYGQRCERGDVVEVRYEPDRRYAPSPTLRPGRGFRVVHEDREIVVVDKMPGVLSSPARGEESDSLAERIAESLKARGFKKPQLYVVHRLDRHTSGLLAFAKTPRALESMTAQFESHEAGRTYIALVEGVVKADRGTIQSWLAEDPRSLSVRTTSLRGAGKRAITHFVVVERFAGATLVRVSLETGRKHQIRIHMAEIGHPVLGDRRYGPGSPLVSRVALHAERLSFRHPRGLEPVVFEAPWPDDLSRLARDLRKGADSNRIGAGRPDAPLSKSPDRDDPSAETRPRDAAGRHGRVSVFPAGLTLTEGPTPESGPRENDRGRGEPTSRGWVKGVAAGIARPVGAGAAEARRVSSSPGQVTRPRSFERVFKGTARGEGRDQRRERGVVPAPRDRVTDAKAAGRPPHDGGNHAPRPGGARNPDDVRSAAMGRPHSRQMSRGPAERLLPSGRNEGGASGHRAAEVEGRRIEPGGRSFPARTAGGGESVRRDPFIARNPARDQARLDRLAKQRAVGYRPPATTRASGRTAPPPARVGGELDGGVPRGRPGRDVARADPSARSGGEKERPGPWPGRPRSPRTGEREGGPRTGGGVRVEPGRGDRHKNRPVGPDGAQAQPRTDPGRDARRGARSGGKFAEAQRKPWEFKEKGTQRRAERRRKIAAAKSKSKAKAKAKAKAKGTKP